MAVSSAVGWKEKADADAEIAEKTLKIYTNEKGSYFRRDHVAFGNA